MTTEGYTTQLQAGLGLIEETRILLNLWSPEMSPTDLKQKALESGSFPNFTFRRLRNIVIESFKPRFLVKDAAPARLLKLLQGVLNQREIEQILYIYTCRANLVLADFVREVYWNTYASGRNTLSVEDARKFIEQANQEGKTFHPWSEGTVIRVARYVGGTCADFGMLEREEKSVRAILPYRIEPRVAVLLAYELHFSGLGDNNVIGHPDWALFGLDRSDTLNELKRLAPQGWFIIQAAGDVAQIAWQYKTMEDLVHALTQ